MKHEIKSEEKKINFTDFVAIYSAAHFPKSRTFFGTRALGNTYLALKKTTKTRNSTLRVKFKHDKTAIESHVKFETVLL